MDPSTFPAGVLAAGIMLVTAALSPGATADIYKWIDEKGIVNYGERPPSQGRARLFDPERSPVTVYQAPSGRASVESPRESDLDARVDELERQLARERQQRENRTAYEADRAAEWLERCRRDRFVDCTEPWDVGYPTVVIHQRAPRWPHHRLQTRSQGQRSLREAQSLPPSEARMPKTTP